MRALFLSAFGTLVLAGCVSASRQNQHVPDHGVVGITDAHLDPEYWIRKSSRAERLALDRSQIAAQNARLLSTDASVYNIEKLPPMLAGTAVHDWIAKLSSRPAKTIYDETGEPVSETTLEQLATALNLDAIPASLTTRYGLVVKRADLRTFPTRLRVFDAKGDTDIDRFQESALFPGAPVVIAHQSRDGRWLFVVNDLYAAWIESAAVAEGSKDEVLRHDEKVPYLIVTGATAKTVFTPELPAVSELQLDMGVRVPLLTNWPSNEPVNGQHPHAAHIIELPVRNDDGSLRFAPALLPKTADVADDYLPLNQANVLRQGFKFLGERYGWGHSYNARDCSGFVSEVYRTFNVRMPRNTRDQGVSPAFKRIELTSADSHAKRLEVLRTLRVGDLVYIPRHVMMVIGHERGVPYVIHDTTGITYRQGDHEGHDRHDHQEPLVRLALNGVSVTPLTPLLVGAGKPMIDSIYSIVQIRR
jgi:cell wall-associated NlpC family hydrolase